MRYEGVRAPVLLAAVASFAFLLVLAFVIAPPIAGLSSVLTQRIFYFHVPAAVAGYVAFGVTLLGSVLYLLRREPGHDRIAASSAEVGVVMTTIGLFTGIVWSRVEFFSASATGGQDFAFVLLTDPKTVTTAALWLTFLAYLALRRATAGEPRARLSSVFGILGFLAVPLSYLSSVFSAHPPPDFVLTPQLNPLLRAYLGAAMAVFLLVFAALFLERWRLAERLEAHPQDAEPFAREGSR